MKTDIYSLRSVIGFNFYLLYRKFYQKKTFEKVSVFIKEFAMFVSNKLWSKRLKADRIGCCLGDTGYTRGGTYVAWSGGESGSGHFIPHYMGIHVKYLYPRATSFFFSAQFKKSAKL